MSDPSSWASKMPLFRGFNLLNKFQTGISSPFVENHFRWIRDWGFNFVRFPMSYHCWATPDDPLTMDEKALAEIDQGIEWGEKYGLHVNLNLHRIPGYCVNLQELEPYLLWESEEALDASCKTWEFFAKRYQGISPEKLSFDLVNEPSQVDSQNYARVAKRLVEAIRSTGTDRLIVSDGIVYGNVPVFEIADLGVAQSCRGYAPAEVSHYRASWIDNSDTWDLPTWPLTVDGVLWDKDKLREVRLTDWKKLEAQGVGIHVGEWGVFNQTPHDVALAFMKDSLEIWKEAGWGWALWEFSGQFGILNSNREDVAYEDWYGQKLDRKMLELLQQF